MVCVLQPLLIQHVLEQCSNFILVEYFFPKVFGELSCKLSNPFLLCKFYGYISPAQGSLQDRNLQIWRGIIFTLRFFKLLILECF